MNHYEALGVPETASEEEIRAAFRQIALACHPDKTSDEEARHRMARASSAYSVLRLPEPRAAYDKERRETMSLGARIREAKAKVKEAAPAKPCACGSPAFPGYTKCWGCLLGDKAAEALESQRLRVKAEASRNRNAQEAAQEAVKAAKKAAKQAKQSASAAERDKRAQAQAEAARKLREQIGRSAAMREQALNEQSKHVRDTTNVHGYDDPIQAPDAETLFQAILSESALRAARGVQKDGVNVWLHITPDLTVQPQGSTVELAREIHKGLKQANRLFGNVKKWLGGR